MNIQAETKSLINPKPRFSPIKQWFYRKFFGVEFLMFFYGVLDVTELVITKKYIYYRIISNLNFIENDVKIHVCYQNASNTTEKSIGDKVQYSSLNYIIGMSLGYSISVLLTSVFYLILAQRFGRRVLLINIGVGFFIKSVLVSLLIFLNWPLKTFIYIETFYGLVGGSTILYALCFSLIANASTVKERNTRIMIGVVISSIGGVIGSISSGYLIKNQDYFSPFVGATLFSIICVLYPIFCLKNLETEVEEYLDLLFIVKNIFKINFSRKKKIFSFSVIFLMFGLYYMGETAASDIVYYILMSYPICMSSIQIGYTFTVEILTLNLGLVFSGVILNKYFNDLVIIIICLTAGIAFNIQMIFAKTITSIYIAYGSNILFSSASPFIKGYISKQIQENLQTYLFIGLTVVEVFLGCIGRVTIILLYQRTLKYYQEIVYLFLSCFTGMALVLSILLAIFKHKDNEDPEEN